jgi:hypothetical protein
VAEEGWITRQFGYTNFTECPVFDGAWLRAGGSLLPAGWELSTTPSGPGPGTPGQWPQLVPEPAASEPELNDTAG